MAKIQMTINGQSYGVEEDSTILEAARANGIAIPTLCNLKGLEARANCRMCVVEVEGMRTLQPSCATKVREGMVVKTDSELVRKNRKATLELILSSHAVDCHHCLRIGSSKCADLDPDFCEMCFFCDCVKDGFCELQALAREYEVDVLPYEMHPYEFEEDTSLGSVIRNPNKCIKCRRCVDVCGEVQTVHTLSMQNRGRDIMVVPGMAVNMKESPCVRCGRCVTVCPTGAVYMKEHKDELVYFAHHYDIRTAVMVSENIFGELEQLFHMEPGSLGIEQIADGLHKIGVDVVAEESLGLELAGKKIPKDLGTPVILTSSYGAKNFIDRYYPDLKEKTLVYPSAQQAFGAYIRDMYAKEQGWERENIRIFTVSNYNENGAEACETGCVDFSMNARELYRIFLRTGVDPKRRRGRKPELSGKRVGVVDLLTPLVWNMEKEPRMRNMLWKNKKISVADACNLGQARILLDRLRAGEKPADVIRIQA